MKEIDSQLADLCLEIISRYSNQYYPNLAQLTSIHFLKQQNVDVKKNVPQTCTNETSKPSENTPLFFSPTSLHPTTTLPQIDSPPPQRKKSSWDLVPMHPDESLQEILKIHYTCLKQYVIPDKVNVPCRIFAQEDEEEEILFCNRLAKVLTRQLFPTRLSLFSKPESVFKNINDSSLFLIPIIAANYKFVNAQYHNTFIEHGKIWLPMYSCAYYENDIQLKRDLWAILSNQPFAYTQK
ncbi:hypothetical protein CP10139811_0557 [Chlamydia ibidis]|uniref:Uncharacterized protein n=2 Tax=Chlamydia ibidis TaxID=1405396 RepID=S7J4A3_9CHLA|nr:hypothetical protein [Chlamydia ibidis]EPP34857.1 hypothetical protein CP10139811_0557 [Chlamydia ibidis]EQM62324.1 hypothetical protein H359_0937 [Chlamydia ibidis 10-1398/6]